MRGFRRDSAAAAAGRAAADGGKRLAARRRSRTTRDFDRTHGTEYGTHLALGGAQSPRRSVGVESERVPGRCYRGSKRRDARERESRRVARSDADGSSRTRRQVIKIISICLLYSFVGLVNDLRDLVNKLSSDVAVRNETLAEGRDAVNRMRQRDFDTPWNDVTALRGEAEKALGIAEDALLSAQAFLDNATQMEQSVKDWIAVLTEARKMVANVSANVNAAAASTAEAEDVLSQIEVYTNDNIILVF